MKGGLAMPKKRSKKRNPTNVALITDILKTHWVPIKPPGCLTEFVDHPGGLRAAIEVAIVQEHRFAFYYWLKWRHNQQLKDEHAVPPNLITVDWHDDVGGDCDFIPEVLDRLDYGNGAELAMFCWCGLRPFNDGHIAPAAFLNSVNDVYVILKQKEDQRRDYPDLYHRPFADRFGNQHMIHYYSSVNEFLRAHEGDPCHPIIFDLDLDYFTKYHGDDFPERGTGEPVSNRTIRGLVKSDSRFMQWLLPRMCGMTIALEPECCGGMHNSLRILDVVSSALFDPPLLQADCQWRHLK